MPRHSLLVAPLLLSLACGTAQLYPGGPRPPEEVAAFSSAAGDLETRIAAIDGTTIHGDGATVLPGPHRILLHLTHSDSEGYELDLFCSVPVTAKAGHIYTTSVDAVRVATKPVATRRGAGRHGRVRPGIVDVGSGEIVGICDCRSRDPYECE